MNSTPQIGKISASHTTLNPLAFKWHIVALILITPTPSLAMCNFKTSNTTTQIMSVSLPKTINLPRDIPLGTTLFESAEFQHTDATEFYCGTTVPWGAQSNLGSATTGSDKFPIGNTGISWQFIYGKAPMTAFGSSTLPFNGIGYTLSPNASSIRFIKTGNIANGATIPAGDAGSLTAETLKLATFRLVNNTVFVPSSCETPNINVNMGQHRLEDIPKDGSPSKKAISFNLKLNNCPAGIKNVSYTLTPLASSPSKSDGQGIISLNLNSTAKGIGLQLTDSNLTPIALNKAKLFSEYSSTGGNFTIPLNARYIQTAKGSDVSPGTANAEITFTMSYQ